MPERRLRVLLVEDDPRVRALVGDILGSAANVVGVHDAAEAERIVGPGLRRRFDLAIVDCMLPTPDGRIAPRGVALIATLHARRPALPILAVTGADHLAAVIVAALRNGARDLLRKPFGVDDFRASVARLTLRAGWDIGIRPRTRAGIARVLAFLAEHVGQRVSLGDLARVAAMSRSHLSRTFRSTVGVPLRAYVKALRLERAQQILTRSPQASLTEVALDAGFYDLPHFDKVFRERYGLSPSEFLRRKALARCRALRGRRRCPA
jgi:AraC-like DNA-binding protein